MPDVVVVGGGIIGCACAFELARSGASVTLFERAELAAGASGRNHGLLLAPLDPSLVPMAAASTSLYEEVRDEAPVPLRLDAERIGYLVAASNEAEADAAKEEAEGAASAGVRIERVQGDELRRLEPALAPNLVEGWVLDEGRRVDPAALTVSLALMARDRGAVLRPHVPVRALIEEGGCVRGAVTDEGAVRADVVVLAAGPWCGALLRPLGIRLPLTGARGWLVHLSPKAPLLTRLVNRAGWHLPAGEEALPPPAAGPVAQGFPEAVVGSLLQPNADGSLLAGGSRQAVVTHEPEDPSVARRILASAIRLVPAIAEAAVLGAWWGIRPMTPDGRPMIGAVQDGLVLATGHGSQGVILGGGTAEAAAALVLGEPPRFDVAPFDPARFL